MAAKKKSGKRPPRSIYLAIGADMDLDGASHWPTRKEADAEVERDKDADTEDTRVVGPYILAERVREK